MEIVFLLIAIITIALYFKYEPYLEVKLENEQYVGYLWYTEKNRDGTISRKYKRFNF